jgi:hypothetical protein
VRGCAAGLERPELAGAGQAIRPLHALREAWRFLLGMRIARRRCSANARLSASVHGCCLILFLAGMSVPFVGEGVGDRSPTRAGGSVAVEADLGDQSDVGIL